MIPLGFAQPLGLLALAALGVLVWLRLRQGQQRQVEIPSLLLWTPVRDDRERRRFRFDLLFLLQAALLLLLALAVAGPYGSAGEAEMPSRRVVFVFDTSASMQTLESGERRFDLARRRARELLAELRDADESMVVAVDVRPRVVAPLTRDRRQIAAAIESLEPSDGLSRLAFGLQLARTARVEGVELEIVVFSDLPRDDLETPIGAGERLRYVRVGRSDDNVAIGALRVEQNPFETGAGARAYAVVRNYSQRTREVGLQVTLAGRDLHREKLALDPGESRVVPIAHLRGAGRLEAALDVGDALAIDDRAFAHVSADRKIRLLAVTARESFAADLRAVAAAAPALALEVVPPRGIDAAKLAAADIAIWHETFPDGPLATNALFVHPPADSPLFEVGGDVVDARILDWDERHPLLRDLRYVEALRLGATRRVRPPDWGRTVITSRSEREEFALAFAGETGGRRVVCLAFDLAETSLRRSDHLSLLLLVLNAVRWLTPPDPNGPLAIDVGETFHETLQEPLAVTVVDPRGRSESRPPLAKLEVAVNQVGEFQLTIGDRKKTLLANLFDADESNVGRTADAGEVVEVGDGVAAAAKRLDAGRKDLVPPLLFAAVALLLIEWFVAFRRTSDAD